MSDAVSPAVYVVFASISTNSANVGQMITIYRIYTYIIQILTCGFEMLCRTCEVQIPPRKSCAT